MIKVCISGSNGKMGSRIADLAKQDGALEVSAEFDAGTEAEPLIEACDCLIEFTTPEATMDHLDICAKHKKAIVIGTTALSDAESGRIKDLSKEIPIVLSPNMSIGVNLLFKIVGDAASVLGSDYTAEVVEAHHEHKKDSPSGTAKEIVRIIKKTKGGVEVPVESVREGEIVGEHTVTFDSPFDTLEITHSAKSRDIFAKGALVAAKFAVTKKHGLFTMKDVLGL